MNDHSGGGGRLERIDLASVRAAANLVDIAGRYLELRRAGNEHEALCPFHGDSDPSLRIYTGRDGVDRFICFPCGAKGDAIDFVGKIENVDAIDAARIIAGRVGPIAPVERKPPPPPDWTPYAPVPADAPPMDPRRLINPRREGSKNRDGKPYTHTPLRPTRTDEYRDATGALLGYVLRCEMDSGEKWTPQITFAAHRDGRRAWIIGPFGEPRPLQGLDALASRPQAPVLVVSGEKCRDVAARVLPGFVAITWPGGDNGWPKVDLAPLNGRAVTFWPDCDASGVNAMRAMAARLSGDLPRFLDVAALAAEFGKGADIADLVDKGWDTARIVAWARANVAAGIPAEWVDAPAERAAPIEPATAETATPSEEGVDVAQAGKGTAAAAPSGNGAGDDSGEKIVESEPSAPDAPSATVDEMATENAGETAEPAAELVEQPHKPRDRKKRGADLVDMPAQSSAAYESITSWSALGLQLSDKGVPHPNLDNAARVLEKHSELRGRFWFDEFLQRMLSTWNADDEPREWTDTDDVRLTLWLQRKLGLGKMAVGTARDAVTAVAMAYRRNECREWLESLTWDGENRLEKLMHEGFAAEDNRYTQAVGRCWLVSMVARGLDPGCKVDTMPVFEGVQGERKSSALELLVGKRWFAEGANDPTKPDFFLALQGKLLVEIGEMDAFNRTEVTTIKRVVSCKVDRYRAPYGRRTEDHPRMGVFAGTTNKDNWNRDETGARRFWPIACRGLLGHAWLAANREQLFAEAVARYYRGESWWDVPDEDARREQEARREGDEWEHLIELHITGRYEVTVTDILDKCLHLPVERWERSTQMRVGTCLRALGWKRETAWRGGKAVKLWTHPEGGKGSNDLIL